MSFNNDNQPQAISCFELNGKNYGVYLTNARSDDLDVYEEDEDGFVIDPLNALLTAHITYGPGSRVVIAFFDHPKDDMSIILETIVTTTKKLFEDVDENFKKLLQS